MPDRFSPTGHRRVTLTGFLIAYGSALVLPLAVIEGPVVTIVTGFLTAQGYFDWWWVLALLVCGDVIGDVVYYWIGRTGANPLISLLCRFGFRGTVTPAFQSDLRQNATRMLLVGKWTHSIGGLVLVGSGALRLPLGRFILVNLLASIPKSAVLFGLGYFVGDHYPFLEQHYVLAGGVACAVGLGTIAIILRRTSGVQAGR